MGPRKPGLWVLMALFVVPLLIAGCSDNSGPAGPSYPATQTGSTDGGLAFALSSRPGPGADQFIITLVITSAGGRPVAGEPVTFTGGKLNPTSTTTDANGTATSVLTCDGVTSPVTVIALFGGIDPADAQIDVPCGGAAGATTATGGGATTLPTVTITATDPAAAEAAAPLDTGTFTVASSSPAPAGGLVVTYAVSGTATSVAVCPGLPGTGAEDYLTLPGTVTIPAGATSATITVTPCDDSVVEVPETVFVALTPGAGYTVGTPSTATVTITSND
ncbi:MAG: hypothetical protein HYV62_08690 [Candidatus Rokubacteria bacterium]|nr:hypothetical protein [Candidatus Rokubacteria bacterium]